MDLSVNISLENALDKGWEILAECFLPDETGFRSELVKKFWPGKAEDGSQETEDRNRKKTQKQ